MCNLLDTKSMFSPCILIPLFILLDSRFHRAAVVKREVRCPVFWDAVWQYEDSKCAQGKRYHCFENEDGEVVVNDCYTPRTCLKGSHPVVEITGIVCSFCQEGFQPQEKLESYDYSFSYCGSHSPPCRPEYGQSECLSATRDRDRACTCNATLGFEPKLNAGLCTCFTPNDPCSGCRFVGCPLGRVRNDRGFCEQEEIRITSAVPATPRPGSTSPPHVNTVSPGGSEHETPVSVRIIVGLLVSIVALLSGLFVAWCCLKKRLSKTDTTAVVVCCPWRKESSKTDTPPGANGEPLLPPAESAPGQQQSNSTCGANGEPLLPPAESAPAQPQPIQQFVVQRIGTFVVKGDVEGLSIGRTHNITTALEGIIVPEGLQNYLSSELSLESVHESRAEEVSATPVDDPQSSALPEPSCEEPALSPQEESTQCPSTPSHEEAEPLLPTAAHFPTQAESASVLEPSSPPASLPDPFAPPASLPDPFAPPASLPDPFAPPASLPDPFAPPASLPDPFAPPASLPDPSAPPASLPDPSAPPASLPDPSAPPASLPDPSAPPASLPDPFAPPASLPDPSASPASLPDPSAPPLSLPDPCAPFPSLPCEDSGHMEEETADTAVKTGRQQDIDATSSPQDAEEAGETEVKTLLADQEQTLTKVVSPAGDSNESTFTHNSQVKNVHGDSAASEESSQLVDDCNSTTAFGRRGRFSPVLSPPSSVNGSAKKKKRKKQAQLAAV